MWDRHAAEGEARLMNTAPVDRTNVVPQHGVAGTQRLLSTVDYANHQSQCCVSPLLGDLAGRTVRLKDLMSAASYDRDGSELGSRGLFLDLPRGVTASLM